MSKHALAGLAATATLAAATAALAHVTLEKRTVAIGGSYQTVLRVPHGCDGQATHTVRVTVPEGFFNAKPMPKPGWTLTTRKAAYAKIYTSHGRKYDRGVVEMTWSGGNLQDDFFDELVFRGTVAGEPGAVMLFPTTQLCANGRIAWNQAPEGGKHGDRLVGASSDIAAKVEIHNHNDDHGIMRMRRVDGVDISAGGVAVLKPGSHHIMPMGLNSSLKEGNSFPLTLQFANAEAVKVEVTIRKDDMHGVHTH